MAGTVLSQLDGAHPVMPPRPPRWRRAWGAPLWAHAAALAVVLLALVPVVGTSASLSADEGAAVIQARSLARGGGWVVAHPLPQVDPGGVHYPLELAQRGPKGSAPFAKHPLYAVILAAADRAGGVVAMVALSLLGTVAAAAAAGLLAGRLGPGLARPALWVAGLASPLLFDGYVVIAHTLGAALAGAAVLAALAALDRRRPARALLVVPLLAALVLLRTEGLFLALALAVVAAALALAARAAPAGRVGGLRPTAAALAAASVAAAAGAYLLERAWTAAVLGGPSVATAQAGGAPAGSGLVAGRLHGFALTWLTAGYGDHPLTAELLLLMVLAVAAGALAARAGRPPRQVVAALAVAAGAAVAAVAAGPGNMVPGLLVAFPLLAAGLVLLTRAALRSTDARVVAGTAALFAAGVAATQYAKGGGGEWGGRYFALGLPLAVPLAVLALSRARLPRAGVAALAACSLAMSVMAVGALHARHRATADLVHAVDAAAAGTGDAAPVVVTTEGAAPRFAWSSFDHQRWLLTDPATLPDLLARLRAVGVARLVFVTKDGAVPPAPIDRRADVGTGGHWHVFLLRLS